MIRPYSVLAAFSLHPDKPGRGDQQERLENEVGPDQENEFGRATEAVPELTSNDPKPRTLDRLKIV